MLKFYEIEGRFPAYREEVPPAVVRYLGSLVKVDPALFARYPWTGRSIKYHKAQIRRVYGTRPPTEDDEDRWARWLAKEICPTETNRDRLAAALRRRCRSEKVEPPSTWPGGARGRLGLPAVRRRLRRDDRRAARARGLRAAAGPAVAAERAGRPEVRPGAAGAGHAAGRDRQAVDGAGARAWTSRCSPGIGPDRGGVACAGGPHVPLGLRGVRRAGAVHAAGRAVLDAAGRACRRPGSC